MQTTTYSEVDYEEGEASLGIEISIPIHLDYAKAYQAVHNLCSRTQIMHFI